MGFVIIKFIKLAKSNDSQLLQHIFNNVVFSPYYYFFIVGREFFSRGYLVLFFKTSPYVCSPDSN